MVDISEPADDLSENELGQGLWDLPPSPQVLKKITSLAKLHEEQVMFGCLLPFKKLHDIGVPHLLHQPHFVLNFFHLVL